MPPPRAFDPASPVAIVTGGARRVGRAIVERLVGEGCQVLFTFLRSESEARQIESLRPGRVLAQPLDLADAGAVEAAGRRWAAELPRLDALVHSASTYDPSPLVSPLAETARRAYAVNALAPLILSCELRGRLGESGLPGGGSLVAMLDIHAMGRPRRDFIAYAMSKAALHEMVRSLSIELAPHVRVNGVAPGVVAWPESGYESDPEAQRRYLRRVPLGRAGEPADAAEAVAWLALRASYVTGEVIRVDGGRWAT